MYSTDPTQETCSVSYIYKVPLRDVVDLTWGGCRKLKRGNAGVPLYR